ncbi:MAG: hypothetical protein U5Q44_12815 [Dehalococcoidia bacterium]|nr:hypothetical protein [Dehalococcoidia bacterium]
MRLLRSRALAITVAMFGVAGLLGGTLGVATAGQRSLESGFNLIGGPIAGDVEPDHFMSCLDSGDWHAVYIWQASNQSWKHYFNPAGGSPDYVNDVAVGGIDEVPRGSGVVVIMENGVEAAYFPDSATQDCP